MYLVDTNLWIEHFKSKNSELVPLLLDGKVVTHDFVIGELSLGSFSKNDRTKILDRLKVIERVPTSSHAMVMDFIEKQKLQAAGIGFIDAHLLHACSAHRVYLLTLDKNLKKQAEKL